MNEAEAKLKPYQQKYAEMAKDGTYHCANCNELFYMGSNYPEDTFCCSHCYHHYQGDPCPDSHDCEECENDV